MATSARWPRRAATCVSALAASAFTCIAVSYAADPDKAVDKIPTASPIKHVIIIVGENRSFDHLFATYVPKHGRVLNLLSEGIIKADGSPGPNFARAHQFQITAPPNGPGNFFISAGASSKTLYSFLPVPNVAGVQNPPNAFILGILGNNSIRCPAFRNGAEAVTIARTIEFPKAMNASLRFTFPTHSAKLRH